MTECRLHRWERFVDDEGNAGVREVAVDHRGALSDALLTYDVPTRVIIQAFEEFIATPDYEAEEERSWEP